MKLTIFIFLCVTSCFGTLAEQPADTVATAVVPTIAERIVAEGKATIVQPAKLNERLRPSVAYTDVADNATRATTGGYRIQAYSGNNARQSKSEAERRAALISGSFPEHTTYVTFDAPYWRLKVGDFRTYEDASAALSLMKAQFPAYAREMRLVRDRIKSE